MWGPNGRSFGHEGRALMNGFLPQSEWLGGGCVHSLPFLPHVRGGIPTESLPFEGYSAQASILEAETKPSLDTKLVGTWISDLASTTKK
jgi:hypothetical protein